MLKAAGISYSNVKGGGHSGESSGVKGGGKHQGTGKPTCKEVRETKGQLQSSRVSSGGHHDISGSGASNILATPMIENGSRPPSESSRRSGDYNFQRLGSEGGWSRADSRGDGERSTTNIPIRPSLQEEFARVPTGPRYPSVQVEPGESLAQASTPRYVSENGWGDYYSKDGIGGMQADRLDL